MKIRSITCYFDPTRPDAHAVLDRLTAFQQAARTRFEQAGYPVQTARLATIPFSQLYPTEEIENAARLAAALEANALQHNFNYLSLGPILPNALDRYRLVPAVLGATTSTFVTGLMASREAGLSLPAVHACAEAVTRIAAVAPDGFTNLRFAALANVGPWGPFFPGAYHQGERPAFALAMECADAALDVFRAAGSLQEARANLVSAFEAAANALTAASADLARHFDLDFRGFDFSPAPYPTEWCSLGNALEQLGLPALGSAGSLASAAFVAEALDRGRWQRAGFNGLMLPVLEDSGLARRAAEGILTIKDLLLYSAVCGVGLDTVPIPGDVTAEELYPILLDLASLALRLDKPLAARLMPIPGKAAGAATTFDFEYFANSRVMPPLAAPLHGLLAGQETYTLNPRPR